MSSHPEPFYWAPDVPCHNGPTHTWMGLCCITCGVAVKRPDRKKPHSLRKRLLLRGDPDICHYCQVALTDLNRTVDHVVPRSRGGSNRMSNYVLACRSCNTDKGNKTLEEWTDRWYNRDMTESQRAVFEWRFRERKQCDNCDTKMQATKKGWKCPRSDCRWEYRQPGLLSLDKNEETG